MPIAECAVRRVLVAVFLTLWAASGAAAEDAFAPKSITVMVPSSPGDGTDGVARVTGRFLSRYLPGKPGMIYVNGAGGLGAGIKMLNDFVMKMQPDGLTVFVGSASNLDPTTLRNPATR